jgi:putative phosphoribosyl transferase
VETNTIQLITFADRRDAATKLAAELAKQGITKPLVLGIPRGGVETGFYIAEQLKGELSVVVTKKIPHPRQPEFAIGAISEEGDVFYDSDPDQFEDELPALLQSLRAEVQRRVQLYRKGEPLPDMKDRAVVITDDGIATGATVAAAVLLCKRKNPSQVIVAAPVAGKEFADPLHLADKIIILSQPAIFYGVGQAYRDFSQLTDQQVLQFLKSANENQRRG